MQKKLHQHFCLAKHTHFKLLLVSEGHMSSDLNQFNYRIIFYEILNFVKKKSSN